MRRKTLKKEVTILIFLLTIGSVSCAYALNLPVSSLKPVVSENTSSEIASCNSEGKPDLVIEDIFLWPSNFPDEYHFEYRLKNIGDAPIYNFQLITNIQIRWLVLGIIPLFSIYSTSKNVFIGRLLINETINIPSISCDSLPKFGTYKFSLTVNPHETIDESDYDNNKYSEDWKVFLGQWKPLQ